MLAKITYTLCRLNALYGYGDVLGVVMDTDWKGGNITIQRTSCHPETRRFRFDLAKNTVHFANRQRNMNRVTID